MNKYEQLLKQFKEDILKINSIPFTDKKLLEDIEKQLINIYRLKFETI